MKNHDPWKTITGIKNLLESLFWAVRTAFLQLIWNGTKNKKTARCVEKVKLSFQCKDSQSYNPETPKWNYMEL